MEASRSLSAAQSLLGRENKLIPGLFSALIFHVALLIEGVVDRGV